MNFSWRCICTERQLSCCSLWPSNVCSLQCMSIIYSFKWKTLFKSEQVQTHSVQHSCGSGGGRGCTLLKFTFPSDPSNNKTWTSFCCFLLLHWLFRLQVLLGSGHVGLPAEESHLLFFLCLINLVFTNTLRKLTLRFKYGWGWLHSFRDLLLIL